MRYIMILPKQQMTRNILSLGNVVLAIDVYHLTVDTSATLAMAQRATYSISSDFVSVFCQNKSALNNYFFHHLAKK